MRTVSRSRIDYRSARRDAMETAELRARHEFSGYWGDPFWRKTKRDAMTGRHSALKEDKTHGNQSLSGRWDFPSGAVPLESHCRHPCHIKPRHPCLGVKALSAFGKESFSGIRRPHRPRNIDRVERVRPDAVSRYDGRPYWKGLPCPNIDPPRRPLPTCRAEFPTSYRTNSPSDSVFTGCEPSSSYS